MCVLCGATSSVVTGYAVILSHSVYYDDGDGDEGGGRGKGGVRNVKPEICMYDICREYGIN